MNDIDLKRISEDRELSRRVITKLHPGNRFRLLAGLPLLPESEGGPPPNIEDLAKDARSVSLQRPICGETRRQNGPGNCK